MYEYLFGPPIILGLGLCIGLYGYLVRVHQWTWLVAGARRTNLPQRSVATIAGGLILAVGLLITGYGLLWQQTSIGGAWVTHSFTIAVVVLTLWSLHRLVTCEPQNTQESISPADD